MSHRGSVPSVLMHTRRSDSGSARMSSPLGTTPPRRIAARMGLADFEILAAFRQGTVYGAEVSHLYQAAHIISHCQSPNLRGVRYDTARVGG